MARVVSIAQAGFGALRAMLSRVSDEICESSNAGCVVPVEELLEALNLVFDVCIRLRRCE